MDHFDYIIAGGGAAGLGLAYRMINSPLRDKKVLIIDKDQKTRNDRTWCFWMDTPGLFDPILYRSWEKIQFISENFRKTYDLHPFRYHMIRGIDFYRHTRGSLEACENVTFLTGGVESIQDGADRAVVTVEGQAYSGDWVFDSIVRPGTIVPQPDRYHYLKQHFRGWEIEVDRDVFDPQVPVMFDFRTPQNGVMRFVYILPFSPRTALVEYTLFSADLLAEEEYEGALKQYIADVLGLDEYRITTREDGVIPMTDHPFPRRLGRRILATGTKGGRVKPSSGYAFLRMQRDSEQIVRSLQETGTPFHLKSDSLRYRFYDTTMLQVMYRHGHGMAEIFTELFRNNPIQRIFHFLNEDQSPGEDIKVLLSIPPWPFLKAAFNVYLRRKI